MRKVARIAVCVVLAGLALGACSRREHAQSAESGAEPGETPAVEMTAQEASSLEAAARESSRRSHSATQR